MKKLFVSVPIEGRKESDIVASMAHMKRIAEATVGEELDMLTTYMPGDEGMHGKDALYSLGLRISALRQADYAAVLSESFRFNDTNVETEVIGRYRIPMIHCSIEHVCKDIPKLDFRKAPIIPWGDEE